MTSANPVLFIFLGRVIRLFEPFAQILDEYNLEGTAFIKMEEHPHSEWIKDEVNRVQQEFIKKPFDSSGTIRINYILSVGDWDLPKLRATVEKYIAMLYPSDIYTDIYWLIDDASALDARTESRRRMMEMLSGKMDTAQVYLMSNIDSNNVLCEQEDVLRTIALLNLFKDYEPFLYPVAPDASRYNEFLFMENAGPGFLTAGCRSLQVPKKELKGFLVGLLLEWRGAVSDFGIGKYLQFDPPFFSEVVDPEYIYGLAVPDVYDSDYGSFPRQVIIDRIFANRLDGILDIYGEVRLPDTGGLMDDMEGLPFFEALDILGEKGSWQNAVRAELEHVNAALDSARSDLQNWLKQKHDVADKDSRKLSFWLKQKKWPYRLAKKYLEISYKIKMLTAQVGHLQQILQSIEDYHITLEEYNQVVGVATESLKWDTDTLDAAFRPFVPNVSKYFLELFKKTVRTEDLQALTGSMTQHLKENTFYDYVAALAQFVEKEILPKVDMPFTDLINYLESESKGQMPQLVSEWAVRGRRFGVLLKTGYVGLYTEANAFMPKDNAAKVKVGYEAHGLGRMNLFADDRANRIDVLYKAGSFGLEDLYYKDLYV